MVSEAVRARTIDSQGAIDMKHGDTAGAMRCFDEALGILDSAYGPNFPQMAEVLIHSGDCLRDLAQDLDGARLRYLKALVILEQAYGLEHSDVVDVVIKIGSILVEQKHMLRAEWWFGYAVVISRACHDRDNTRIAIPYLFRLRQTGVMFANPQLYQKEHEKLLSKVLDLYGPESSQWEEAQRFQEALVEYISTQKSADSYSHLWTVLVGFLLILLPLGAWWAGTMKPAFAGLFPYAILIDIVFIAFCALGYWALRRAENGRPVFFTVGEKQELKEYEDLKGGGLQIQALLAFWRYKRRGDSFAELAEADTRLALGTPRLAIRILDHMLRAQPGQASLLRRRVLAKLDQADENANVNDRLRDATAALSDLDDAAQSEPDSRFAQLLRTRALKLLGIDDEATTSTRPPDLGPDEA